VCHLSERDCSIQRRHQKLVEECPSSFVDQKLRKRMGAAAVKAAKAINYESLGTVEFLVDKNKHFYFMEMNTRVQVEHPVTEESMEVDLIWEQMKIAAGEEVTSKEYFPRRHAIECRINAEDPFKNFSPSPGKIDIFYTPKGHGVRVETHAYTGYTVPPHYDSMIAKVITFGKTRDEALNIMRRALGEFVVLGIKTTIPFHQKLLEHPQFISGQFDTKFLENVNLLKK